MYTTSTPHSGIRPEIDVLQATYADRFVSYRSKIREIFAHRGSVLFVVPTVADIDRAVELLSHGIENRVVVFSPTYTKKKLKNAYKDFYDFCHAKLIVTTPTHAYLDRHDITHIILDQAQSKYYKSKVRPYLDHREVLKELAFVTDRTMTLGDILPKTEDEYKRKNEVYATLAEHPKRIAFASKFVICQQKNEPTAEKPFALFLPEVITALTETTKSRGHSLILAARRGLAPVVVCIDCGYVFRCPDSGAPYSLFKTNNNGMEERWFLSQTSGKRVRAADTCTKCGSWRLRERGIGIQYIQSELHEIFPNVPVILFDHTTATTYKKACTIIGKFYDTQGSILLATQMVLPYIERPVDTTVVTSHDATRAIPSWRAEEEFFALLLKLREITAETMYIQTRTEPDDLLLSAQQGLVEQFYTDELELRESLLYPPFSTFILLTWQDTKEKVLFIEAEIAKLLATYKPQFYSAPHSLVSKTKRFGLIRVHSNKWPNDDLRKRLLTLPPNIKIEINPDRIV